MGFSYRKSFKLAPGVRMNLSKSGIGYSVGGKGVRVTKRARGGFHTSLHVPGTGLSYTTSASPRTRKRSKLGPADPLPKRTRRRATGNAPRQEVRSSVPEPTPQETQMHQVGQFEMASRRAHRNFRIAGRWYYLVLIATAGLFAWVPFLHAAIRLKTPKARLLTLMFASLDALIYVLLVLTPQNSLGHVTNGPLSTVGGLLAVGTIIVGCVMVAPLRRMAYEGAPADAAKELPTDDPAIMAALAARARRDDARKLADDDPLLARELHIGRPDMTRTYDDGGLVDLNSASAYLIAYMCGIPVDVAVTIADARNQRGEPFANVDEMFVMVGPPVSTWDRIRDRAVLLP